MLLGTTPSLPLVATVLLAFLGSYSATAFTTTPSRPIATHIFFPPIPATTIMIPHQLDPIGTSKVPAKSATALHMNNNNSSPPTDSKKRNDKTYGMENGRYIFVLAIAINIWMFSIPTEFRRARFCKEEDVKLHPDSKCTTFGAWREGIAEYYANGGGVKFDFSVEGKE